MSLFSDRAAGALQQQSVQATIGAAFHFSPSVQRYLRSSEPRRDPAGVLWKAGSTFVNIDGLQFGVGRRTQPLTLTMAGLPAALLAEKIAQSGSDVTGDGRTFFDLAKSQADDVRGRKIEFFLHLFNNDWSYVDLPTSLGIYVMDRLTPAFDGQNQVAAVKLTCEPIGVSKFRAPNAYLDRRDQRARYPDDGGLDFMPRYVVQQTLPPW